MKKYIHSKMQLVPLYGPYVGIVISNDAAKINKLVGADNDEYYGMTIKGDHSAITPRGDMGTHACVYLVINPEHSSADITHGTISHEVFHTVDSILDRVNADINECTDQNNEHAAYLIGWLTDEVYKLLAKHNIAISYK